MAYQKSIMTTHQGLVMEIENILTTDLGFLYELSPRELNILAISLKDLVPQKRKYILIDYSWESIDF